MAIGDRTKDALLAYLMRQYHITTLQIAHEELERALQEQIVVISDRQTLRYVLVESHNIGKQP